MTDATDIWAHTAHNLAVTGAMASKTEKKNRFQKRMAFIIIMSKQRYLV